MSDPRLTPDPTRVNESTPRRLNAPVADLCRSPDGARDRQLIFGAEVTQLGQSGGHAYVQAQADGYLGWLAASTLSAPRGPTHRVATRAATLYAAPDIKSPDVMHLSYASRVTVTAEHEKFLETPEGFLPRAQAKPVSDKETDPAAVAALFLGTPYLWGGNSAWGIDCSGLVQAALLACAIPCPGDSDMQASLGTPANGPYQRNDLLFWRGHVALVTDPETLIHANAHSMTTTYETIATAIDRIAAQGDGPVTAHRRL